MANLDPFKAHDVRGRIPDEIKPMESKLARQLQDDLIAAIGRLSPEARLKAFLAHCRLVTELYEAGRRHRARPSQPAES